MAIISPFSAVYSVVSGKNKGRFCVIRRLADSNESVEVVFIDCNPEQFMVMKKGKLAQLETPGWPEETNEHSYGLQDYLAKHRGDGTNMLRTVNIVQPRALKIGDVLSTGEIVTEDPRRGYNSSSLIRLDKSGWVELAPRLPIALQGNKRLKLPCDLIKNDKLATGCLIVKRPTSLEINWTNIFLNREDCCIEVPSCIPLALS